MAGKLDHMAGRVDDELGLDAPDALTWHVRQWLLNDSRIVAELERMTREHLAARNDCPSCGGTGRRLVRADQPELGDEACPRCDTGKVPRYPHQLGEVIRDYVETVAGLGGCRRLHGAGGKQLVGFDGGALVLPEAASVLIGAALPWIDWNELAEEQIAAERSREREQAERRDQAQADEIRAESEGRA